MKPNDFRALALAIQGVIESSHMNHPDFRYGGKIFASLGAPDDQWGMVKLTPQQQRAFVALDEKVFQPCRGAWGKRGCTNVRLRAAKKQMVQDALHAACDNLSGSPKKSKPKSKSTAPAKIKKSPAALAKKESRGKLNRIRKICLSLPDAVETETWGKPHFRIHDKIFAGTEDGNIVGCKLEKQHAAAMIQLPGFSKAPYVGRHGWVSIDLNVVQDWNLIGELIRESYDLVSN